MQRFNLATSLRYRKQFRPSGDQPPGEFDVSFIGSGRVGDVRLRGATSFEASPHARFRTAELSAYWSASDSVDWEGQVAYDGPARRGRARLTHIRRVNTMAIALTGEAASDGSLAAGVNINFSLDPRHGFELSRKPLAQAGIVRATVYRDLNDNGVRDRLEPLEKGALITTGTALADRPTNAAGIATVAGLPAYTPVAVGIDESSLADPMLVPKRALQVVVPRPGIPAEVHIGLVGGGAIEGALMKSGSLGFEGLDLELVDEAGKVVATTRTDFDGFFLFERVAYGRYRLRIAAASAEAAGIFPDLQSMIALTSEKSVVRLGAIHVVPATRIASAVAAPATP